MSYPKLLQLQAERSSLTRMIEEIPPEDVIDRGSLQARLEMVDAELGMMENQRFPARARLTFSGRPVIGSYGIMADFGMKAVNAFSEAVTAVAASLTAPLRAMGPIPNREQNQLLITNTALGSFGFELEELPPEQLALGEASIVEQAIERTQSLLAATVQPDDEALADSASELDQRALDKVRAFIKTLEENDALCALHFGSRDFRFSSSAQVRRSIERMSEGNLHEDEKTLVGHFEGVLPNKRRTFEFMEQGAREVIVGKIGPGVTHPENINEHLKHSCRIRVVVTRVGTGRPRYLLKEAPEWLQAGT
jgi:hypothetical protein